MSQSSRHYLAYGLHICSDIPIPELRPLCPDWLPDVQVRIDRIDARPADGESQRGCFRASAREVYFHWHEDGVYLVRDGREIIVDPAKEADPKLLRLVITGIALGVLLHQRGFLTLHSSGVEIGGGAVLFIGEKGYGKSTTAAALNYAGYRIITDDVAAIQPGKTHLAPRCSGARQGAFGATSSPPSSSETRI